MGYGMRLATVGLLVLGMAAPVAAQEAEAKAESSGPHLPADSMELGAKYINFIMDYDAGDLWEHFSDELKDSRGSVGELLDSMAGIFEQIGSPENVISQRYWMRNGKPQFWHTAKFTNIDEPIVFRLVIEPDGKISGIGISPESRNPPVDDPDQHSDEDAGSGADSDA